MILSEAPEAWRETPDAEDISASGVRRLASGACYFFSNTAMDSTWVV
jgi:hypothetical protein